VVRIERQARWRPAWWVDLERDGELLELCVRGDRFDSPSAFSLEHERIFQTLLSERGIRVARVHGFHDANPKAYVMDRVAGRDNFDGESDDDRRSAMEDYVDILFEMHQLDVTPFSDAGVVRAATPQESHRVGLRHFVERAYRSIKKRPDPFLEFALAWLDRNEPHNPGREAAIVWDAGQFHQRGGRIVSLLDLEFGHIGDPLSDLAGLWVRNPFIAFGDVAALMRRYEKRSGTPIDLAAVHWHYILWALSNQLEFHAVLADPVPGTDYMLNLHWCIETNLMALEAIATAAGVTCGDVEEFESVESGYGPAHQHLERSLEMLPTEDSVSRYELRKSVRLARHIERIDEIGDQVVAADLADIEKLTGYHSDSWAAGEAELERFVLTDNGLHDEQIVQVFHRRLHRARMLNGPAGSWITQHRDVPQPSR
jgi:aminoglycoside phosphotransferase (APT) family kinase protein